MCKKCYRKKYRQTPKQKEYKTKYIRSEKYKKYLKNYSKSENRLAYLHSEKRKIQAREYAREYRNTETYKTYQKNYERQEINKQRRKTRRKNSINHKLSVQIRKRTKEALQGQPKACSFAKSLGCSISELKRYLELKFQPGMTWDNHGTYGWHIDHIIPLSSFDLTDKDQFMKACHYTNLQPLWAKDNLRKGAKLPEELSSRSSLSNDSTPECPEQIQ